MVLLFEEQTWTIGFLKWPFLKRNLDFSNFAGKMSFVPLIFSKGLRPLFISNRKSSPLTMVLAGFPINFEPSLNLNLTNIHRDTRSQLLKKSDSVI